MLRNACAPFLSRRERTSYSDPVRSRFVISVLRSLANWSLLKVTFIITWFAISSAVLVLGAAFSAFSGLVSAFFATVSATTSAVSSTVSSLSFKVSSSSFKVSTAGSVIFFLVAIMFVLS